MSSTALAQVAVNCLKGVANSIRAISGTVLRRDIFTKAAGLQQAAHLQPEPKRGMIRMTWLKARYAFFTERFVEETEVKLAQVENLHPINAKDAWTKTLERACSVSNAFNGCDPGDITDTLELASKCVKQAFSISGLFASAGGDGVDGFLIDNGDGMGKNAGPRFVPIEGNGRLVALQWFHQWTSSRSPRPEDASFNFSARSLSLSKLKDRPSWLSSTNVNTGTALVGVIRDCQEKLGTHRFVQIPDQRLCTLDAEEPGSNEILNDAYTAYVQNIAYTLPDQSL